jgi:protein-S-isoprenylcysteine O-methyltransferase Ste14
MKPLVFRDALAAALFAGSWAAGFVSGRVVRRRPRLERTPAGDRGTRKVLVATGLASLAVAVLLAWFVRALAIPGPPWLAFAAGLGLYWAGRLLRWWAVRTLGPYFVGVVHVQAGHRVVDSGPYRFVRHPGYAGALVRVAGIGLMLGNAGSLAILVVANFGALRRRILVEEDELERALGGDYRRYCERTSRLVPGVW